MFCNKCEKRNDEASKSPYDYYHCIWCLKNGKRIGGENGANEVSHYLNPICDSCADKRHLCPGCKCMLKKNKSIESFRDMRRIFLSRVKVKTPASQNLIQK